MGGDLYRVTVEKSQTNATNVKMCILGCSRFDETLENPQWRNVKIETDKSLDFSEERLGALVWSHATESATKLELWI